LASDRRRCGEINEPCPELEGIGRYLSFLAEKRSHIFNRTLSRFYSSKTCGAGGVVGLAWVSISLHGLSERFILDQCLTRFHT
jgi:hypothetical protein